MKAVVCTGYGPIDQLRVHEVPEPELKPGCVRVRMTVASINPPDVLMPQGKYQVKPATPFVAGVEGAGEVVESAPGVQGFAPGDRVMTYAGVGCFAEQAVVPAERVFPIPAAMDDEAASGFVLAYGTVYHSLVDCARLVARETLVVLGASGGLGLAAIQIGKALDAKVIAVASSKEKLAKCAAHGADELVNGNEGALRDRIKALTGGRGANVIFDIVGGDVTEAALRAIAPYGRLVIAGYASGHIPSIKGNLVLLKQAIVVGASYRLFAEGDPQAARRNMNKLCEWWKRGLLRPEVTTRYPLTAVVDALRLVADRKVVGKAALLI